MRHPSLFRFAFLLMGLGVGCVASAARADDEAVPAPTPKTAPANLSLHERIDRMIESGREGKLAAQSTDGEFVRRIYLDLIGMIPTASETREFLDDPSPYKREGLIDRLLTSPEHPRRLAITFDVMLMERREQRNVRKDEWRKFLVESFADNKPYDQLAREILSADGRGPDQRGEARFVLERGGDPYMLTRDVGRLFLGRDMQCAQCHDHPLVDGYKQAHYQGLFAFFNRVYAIDGEGNKIRLGEKADGDVTYKSVFKKKVSHATGPRILDAAPLVEPAVQKGDEYWIAPGNGVTAIPKYSRRARLAEAITSNQTPQFARNSANRLWALLMGRGLVQPLDWDNPDNPPAYPELLELLSTEFAASKYDVKAFLRELALTRTYQRSSEPPPGVSEGDLGAEAFATASLDPLSPEQLGWSLMQAVGIVTEKRAEVERRLYQLDPKFAAIAATDVKTRQLAVRTVEAEVFQALAGNVEPFVRNFSAAAGQAQDKADPTVHQALFLANGHPIQGWLAAIGAGVATKVATNPDPAAVGDELYLRLLSRRPTGEERDEVARYLAQRSADKPKAVQELAWAIVTSVEFRFNH